MKNTDVATLYTLGDWGKTIEGVVNDVRGRTVRDVKDTDGAAIGMVTDLLVDDREETVRFLVVEQAGFLGMGETRTLLPVEAVSSVTAEGVLIDQSSERVSTAPGYIPELVDDHAHHSSIYRHYLLAPYRGQWDAE